MILLVLYLVTLGLSAIAISLIVLNAYFREQDEKLIDLTKPKH